MTQEKRLELVIKDSGFVTVPIIDRDGSELGSFKFNPNDFDILKRYEHVVKELENLEVPENAGEEALFAVSDKIKELLDYLLNFKVSQDIFAICNPLSLTGDGDFFAERIIEGIGGLIESTMNQRLAKKQAKIRKATEKYHNKS